MKATWSVTALALGLGFAAVLPASAADGSAGDGIVAQQEYLKREGSRWVRVIRDDTSGAALSRTEASAPSAPLGARSSLAASPGAAAVTSAASPFLPYVAYTTGSWPEAVAVGDVNGDGRNDVVMVTSYYFDAANDYMLHVWIQNPDGTLAPRVKYPIGGDPNSVAIGDVDDDGRNDVVVANGSGLGVFLQNAQGTLQPMVLHTTTDSECVRVADLNNDGLLDVVGIGWGTGTASVLLQQSDGTLGAPIVYSAPHAGYDDLEVGDVNGDGLTDVVVMSGQLYAIPNFTVLYQQQDGTLGAAVSHTIGTNHLAGGIGVGDVDSDTRNDVVVGMNWAGGGTPEIDVFLQQPSGSLLTNPSYSRSMGYPEPVEVGDVTNDGHADVIAFDGYVSGLVLFRQSSGVLGNGEPLSFPYATHLNRHGIAIGDINGDGFNDVVVANYNYGLVVYLNTGPKITVTAPTGTILVGTPTTITWTADSNFASFDVSYSLDGGATYAPVPGCEALPGTTTSCLWPSPGPATTQGRVKVTGRNGAGTVLTNGISSFSIAQPYLTVTSPNTAVVWEAGVSQAITWSSNLGSAALVAIELSRDDAVTWETVAAAVPNSGYYLWNVANPTTGAARVRVTWTANPAISDLSDVVFTIDRSPSANAGVNRTIEVGASTTLDGFASSDPDGDPLTYAWYLGSTVISTSATAAVTPPLGAHTYSLVVTDPFGRFSTAFVTVQVEDTTPPAIFVVSPIPGSILAPDLPVEVAWTALELGSLASFDVSASADSGGTYSPIAACTHLPPDARTCSWTPTLTTTGTAVIRVLGRDAEGNGGAGGASYAVSAAPNIRVVAPNGGDVWRIGSKKRISWVHNLGKGSCVAIDVTRDGGATWQPITARKCTKPESGSYAWKVTAPETSHARIRVTSVQGEASDSSDTDFSVVKK